MCENQQNLKHLDISSVLFVTVRIRRMGKVMFSVCPHLGGVRSESSQGGGQVRVQLEGGLGQSPAGGGQVRVQLGGGSGQSSQGGVSPAGGGSVQPAGGGGSVSGGGGGSASCTLLWAVCLLRSRRRTFLLLEMQTYQQFGLWLDGFGG